MCKVNFLASSFRPGLFRFFCAATHGFLILTLLAVAGCGGGSQPPSSGSGSSEAPDFQLSLGNPSISIPQGGSQTVPVITSSLNSFSGSVSVTLSGLPLGVTASPATFSLPATGMQAVTFTVAAGTAAVGAATVTVQAVSGSITHAANLSISVLGPPSFTLSLHPSSLTLNRSQNQTIEVSAQGVNGFTGSISVSISGLPAGVTASTTNFTVLANTSAPITLTTDNTVVAGNTNIQFSGSSGSLKDSTTLALTINTTPDFSLSSGSSTASVNASATTSIAITATGSNGFNAPIQVTFAGLPTGVTASTASFVLSPGSTQNVILSAALSAPPETTAEVLVTGVSGSLSRSTQFNLIVSPVTLNISAQPGSVTVPAGSSALTEVSIGGINGSTQGSIAFQVTGLPNGVTASPASTTFPGAGANFDLIFSAGTGASSGNATLKVTFGSATSSMNIPISIGPPPIITPVPLTSRSKFVRTDADADYSEFPPPHWTVYDSANQRFFSSDYSLGHLNVFDEKTETTIASLNIPGAFGIDIAPDNSVLYVGTLSGDLYLVDPVNLVVTMRYLSSSIGASGFAANAVYALAGGALLLQRYFLVPGLSWVDGNGPPVIWKPSTNATTQLTGLSSGGCGKTFEFGLLTSGRTRFAMTPTLSSEGSSNLCSIDLSSQSVVISPTLQTGTNSSLTTLAVSPDGNNIAAFDGSTIWILDAATLAVKNSFAAGVSQTTFNYPNMVIGPDNQTIYLTSSPQFSFVYVYNLVTGQQTGWLPAIQNLNRAPLIQAISDDGLLGGVIPEGFGLIDTTQVKPLPTGVPFAPSTLMPTFGPVQGGAEVTWQASGFGFSNAVNLGSIYFNAVPATNTAYSTVIGSSLFATTPAGRAGPVDVVTLTTDGGEQFIPEGYSYGPWVVENTTSYATAEGGGPGSFYGYGFGDYYPVGNVTRLAEPPTDLSVTLGGKSVSLTGYYPDAFQLAASGAGGFPLEGLEYTMPPGTAGNASDMMVTNGAGSNIVKAGITYLPAIQSFPVNGQLLDGIYDPHRDVYYFSDVNQVRVFSRTAGKWLNSIPIPSPAGAYGPQRLLALALSPDGSKLAISDAGAIAVYVLNPDQPASIQSFAFASQISPVYQYAICATPAGVTISDNGQVWFATFDQNGDGCPFLYSLNTSTGTIAPVGGVTGYIGNQGDYPYGRLPMAADSSRFYFVNEGQIGSVNTSTGAITYCNQCENLGAGGYDAVLDANGTSLYADGLLLDDLMNIQGFQTLNVREGFDASYVYGANLSPDGALLFQPGTQAIDVFDGRTGAFRARVSLPVPLSQNYRALVGDSKDNVQVAITGVAGNGIAVIDLSSLREPPALPYPTTRGPGGAEPQNLAQPAPRNGPATTGASTKGPVRPTLHRHWRYDTNR